ncbi:MAG: hypothetical protein V4736_07860 [Bdellovibrionota bacterium]
MIKNVLILLYVFGVLFLSATAKAEVNITDAVFNAKLQQVSVEGIHDLAGAIELTPVLVEMQGNDVLLSMEPSCGRSCHFSTEKSFATIFDVADLGLTPGISYNLYVLENKVPRFLGSVKTNHINVEPQHDLLEGVLSKAGSELVLVIGNETIYLAVPPQVNVDQFLGKHVVVSGFENVFNLVDSDTKVSRIANWAASSKAKFYVLSIAESDIL